MMHIMPINPPKNNLHL